MVYHSARFIPVHIALHSGTIPHIHVFQISKILLIEQSQFFQHRLSVNSRTATGCKYSAWPTIPSRVLSLTSGVCPAQCTIIVPRIINQIRSGHGQHLCAHRKTGSVSTQSLCQTRYKVFLHRRIIIQQNHPWRMRRPYSRIDSSGKSTVLRETDQPDFGKMLPDQFHASVCRAVVHHNDGKGGVFTGIQ